MSTPTPEEAFLEYARSTGWDKTAVRVVLDTVRKARHAAALEMHEHCRVLEDALRACVEQMNMVAHHPPDFAAAVEGGQKLLEEKSADE